LGKVRFERDDDGDGDDDINTVARFTITAESIRFEPIRADLIMIHWEFDHGSIMVRSGRIRDWSNLFKDRVQEVRTQIPFPFPFPFPFR
jgi:hypothetical protein